MSDKDQEQKYKMPLEEALRRVCIVHPEARLQENNKLLNWLVVEQYSTEFHKLIYDHPELMDALIKSVPDFDSITRARQKMQNQCHTCVKPDTLILGDNTSIAQLEVGSGVIGQKGHDYVTETFCRQYDGNLIFVKPHGMLPFECTPNHPIFVTWVRCKWVVDTRRRKRLIPYQNYYKGTNKVYSGIRQFQPYKKSWVPTTTEWVDAEKLTITKSNTQPRMYLSIPRLQGIFDLTEIDLKPFTNEHGYFVLKAKQLPCVFPINRDTAWLLGLYVAEGSSNGQGAIGFSLGSHERALAAKAEGVIRKLGYSSYRVKKNSVTNVTFNSRPLERLFKQICGYKATDKKIPDVILLHKNIGLLKSFLHGYCAGDGSDFKNHGRSAGIEVVTVSKILILQLQLAYARFGLFMAINHNYKAKESKICGRTVNTHDRYTGRVFAIRKKKVSTITLDDRILVQITGMGQIPYTGEVRNIATSSNTYLVSNVIVHNCNHSREHHESGECSKCSCHTFNGWFTEEEARKVMHTDISAFFG